MAKRDFELGQSHSVEEADAVHQRKRRRAAASDPAAEPEPATGDESG